MASQVSISEGHQCFVYLDDGCRCHCNLFCVLDKWLVRCLSLEVISALCIWMMVIAVLVVAFYLKMDWIRSRVAMSAIIPTAVTACERKFFYLLDLPVTNITIFFVI